MFRRFFVILVGLLFLLGGTTSADSFEVSGSGIQNFDHELTGGEIVQPGGVIRVTISNNRPGYQRFFLYIAGEDEQGNEIMLWGTFVGGTNCRPGTSCVFDVPNIPQLGMPATELGVTGFFGTSSSRASVDHVTFNP